MFFFRRSGCRRTSQSAAFMRLSGCLLPASERLMCEHVTPDAVLTAYAKRLVSCKAWQLSRTTGFRRHEAEDLEQDLWAAVLTQIAKFDPARASINTFINRVVNTTVARLVRERQRSKRAVSAHTQSIDRAPCPRRGVTGRGLAETDDRRRSQMSAADGRRATETEEAFQSAFSSLPLALQQVCQCVMSGAVVSAARELGTSRRQVKNSLEAAREFFSKAGFED
jgi:RNA polymerase sigma factor (sigma-70 family)